MIAIIPYSLSLQAPTLEKLPLPLEMLIPLQLLQNAVLLAIAIGLGLLLARRTGLGVPLVERWLSGKTVLEEVKAIVVPSVILGVIAGSIIVALEAGFFAPRMGEALSQVPEVPAWQSFLACFYGGITEELLMRLGLFSLLAWLLGKINHTAEGFPSGVALWAANILVAVLFGIGHLPATATLVPLTPLIVTRALVLNGTAALAFGYLYWTRGLESAMLAHFTADFFCATDFAPIAEVDCMRSGRFGRDMRMTASCKLRLRLRQGQRSRPRQLAPGYQKFQIHIPAEQA